jgi:glycosyltransferase involved in cell wall biosynthesis
VLKRLASRATANARAMLDYVRASRTNADIALFFDFRPAPYGGGNQFMRALSNEFARRGLRLENNTQSPTTRACLFNSFNFDESRLRIMRRPGCRMVHRVDGPVDVYRGIDAGVDRRIQAVNRELADATILQSRYSLERHREMGIEYVDPVVIMNAVDPSIFRPSERTGLDGGRKIRLIASSWSDNPNKGAGTYRWLEERLDWDRFEFTFAGRSKVEFRRLSHLPPMPSEPLAEVLRQHDIFITASLNEPCSNALLEALSCGLPAIYADSGSNGEIVGDAGFGYREDEEIVPLIDRLVDEYESRRAKISVPGIRDVADRYLEVMRIGGAS